MKALLFIPNLYTIQNTLIRGFENSNYEVENIDYTALFSKQRNYIFRKTLGLPRRINKGIFEKYIRDINRSYINIVESKKPDLIVIYNNQYFLPETILRIKESTKIIFILGDNPLYTHTSDYNLSILQHASVIISPDSYWTEQLHRIGINNIYTDLWGYDPQLNYIIEKTEKDLGSIFIGGNYRGAAAYKRASFYNELSDLDFELHGPKTWIPWVDYFPKLKSSFHLQDVRYSNEKVNKLLNRTKVYAIENNPGIFNGIHLRFFECLGSGVLPIPEHTKDVEFYAKEFDLPTIKHVSEVKEKVAEYANNDFLRLTLIDRVKQFVDDQYSPESFVKRLFVKLDNYMKI